MIKMLEKPYVFWYFHSKTTKHAMLFLKSCYKKLPLKFIFNLDKLYLIHTGIFAKSSFFLQSGYHAKLLKKKSKFLKDFDKLIKDPDFHKDYLSIIPEEIYKRSEESLMISHMLPAKQDFIGVSLESLQLSDNGVPEIITLMVSYFDVNKKYMKTKGVFRCSAGEKDMKKLEKTLIDKDHDHLYEIENPHIVAGMLKRVLNKSLDPLLLFENYEEIVNLGSLNSNKNPEEVLGKMKGFIETKLPKFNQRVFSFILAFLRRIIKKKDENSMDSFNIAMVFAPCFVRPKVYGPEDIKKTAFVITFLKTAIENYHNIFDERFPDCSSSESELNEGALNEFPEEKQGLKVDNYNANFTNNLYLKTDEEQDLQLRKNTVQPKMQGLNVEKVYLVSAYRKITDVVHSDFEGRKIVNFGDKKKEGGMLLLKKKTSKKNPLQTTISVFPEEKKEAKNPLTVSDFPEEEKKEEKNLTVSFFPAEEKKDEMND